MFALLINGCSNKNYTLAQEEKEAVQQDTTHGNIIYENKIAPLDRVLIDIYNGDKPFGTNSVTTAYQDDKRGFLVASNGTVYLPLLGQVGIAGLSERQATNMLTKYYKKYLKYPFIKVSILNQKIYVLGEVTKPGVINVVNENMNLLEALAQSGDLTDYAKRDDIKIISQIDGEKKIRTIDLTRLSKINEANLMIRPNEIIYIPPRGIKSFNVTMKDATPVLDIVGKLLAPFVDMKYLTN